MRELPRRRECAAIIGERPPRSKIVDYQRCQGGVLAQIDGVGLCGTHINLIGDGEPILVLRELTAPEGA